LSRVAGKLARPVLRGPRRSNALGLPDRDLRPIKTQLKISGCHAAENGAKNWLTIRSYLVTALKHGLGALDAVLGDPRQPLDATSYDPSLIDITEYPSI
jgi:hypothetical protein